MTKNCNKCKIEKTRDNCVMKRHKNPEKVSVKNKKYQKKNPDKIAENSKRWAIKNPKRKASIDNKSRKKRRQTDSIFRSRDYASTTIRNHILLCGGSKNQNSINNFLPWTWEEYRLHIEALFLHPDNLIDNKPWMNWNNQGTYIKKNWNDNDPKTWKWQLDHITPHSEFSYISMDCQEFLNCWALSNLRPLSAKQNVLEGVKRVRHKASKNKKT